MLVFSSVESQSLFALVMGKRDTREILMRNRIKLVCLAELCRNLALCNTCRAPEQCKEPLPHLSSSHSKSHLSITINGQIRRLLSVGVKRVTFMR